MPAYRPLTGVPRRIKARVLREALDKILDDTYDEADSAEDIPGVVGALVAQGYELFGDVEEVQAWLKEIVSRGNLIIDGDGVWHEVGSYGVRIYKFPTTVSEDG